MESPASNLSPLSYRSRSLANASRQQARGHGYLPLEEVAGKVITVTVPFKNRKRPAPIEVSDSNSAISKMAAFVSEVEVKEVH